jgi:hypothetical protein
MHCGRHTTFGNSGRVPGGCGLWAGRSGQRRGHRDPGTISGYGVLVSLGERAGGEQCPQCGESDLRPYGNSSKWAALGVTSSCRAVRGARWPRGPGARLGRARRWRVRGGRAQGRPVPGPAMVPTAATYLTSERSPRADRITGPRSRNVVSPTRVPSKPARFGREASVAV